ELCGLKMLLDEERYLLWGCRNLVIETDAKYLFGMLNNPGKLPNAMINCWVSEIRNFQFTMVHKEGKIFGPDGLSRQRYYPGDKTTRNFDDGTDDEGEEFELEKATPETSDPLPLDEFWDDINTRTGFMNEVAQGIEDFTWELSWAQEERTAKELARKKLASELGCSKALNSFLNESLGERIIPDINKFNPSDPAYEYNEEIRSPVAKKQDE
ncbi:hypothetical protein AN958_11661, partial [Leucoagaricus sp. SymC.cos]